MLRPVAVDLPGPELDVALRGQGSPGASQPAVEGSARGRICGRMWEVLLAGLLDRCVPGRRALRSRVAARSGMSSRLRLTAFSISLWSSSVVRAGGSYLDQQSRDRADAQAVAGRISEGCGGWPGCFSPADRSLPGRRGRPRRQLDARQAHRIDSHPWLPAAPGTTRPADCQQRGFEIRPVLEWRAAIGVNADDAGVADPRARRSHGPPCR